MKTGHLLTTLHHNYRDRKVPRAVLSFLLTPLFFIGLAWPDRSYAATDYLNMSIEELLMIEVTSVRKGSGSLNDSAAAVFVITQEDIRRSGVTSIPEALRMVPGVQVARIDANKWAISTRGFNGRYTNKLLVLIDGRSIYSPLFSGVLWDVQDTVLEDIDRIEVIRGPGATLWGANAVNGVINIITLSAQETSGGMLSLLGGKEDRSIGTFRYGAPLSPDTNLRAFVKYSRHDNGELSGAAQGNDEWSARRGGFRLDSDLSSKNSLTVQGDLYNSNSGQTDAFATPTFPYASVQQTEADTHGGNLLARWNHKKADETQSTLQIYYDNSFMDDEGTVKAKNQTMDIDFQNNFRLHEVHEIIWGASYRLNKDEISNIQPNLTIEPDSRTDHLYSLFAQLDLELVPEQFRLIVGSKFEHNNYTGYEYQPNARAIWTISPKHSIWGAVSRAVRVPSRVEHDGSLVSTTIPPTPSSLLLPTVVIVDGNRNFKSEDLLAWEGGYRTLLSEKLSLDLAVFYNQYTDHRAGQIADPVPVPLSPNPADWQYFLLQSDIANKAEVDTKGFEVAIDWKPIDWCRVITAYNYLDINVKFDSGSNDPFSAYFLEKFNPQNQLSLRTQFDLPLNFEIDTWLRYVSALDKKTVDAYTELDMRIGYRPLPVWEFSLVGQNLLNDSHQEFSPEFQLIPTQVERTIYAKATWNF